MPSRKSKIRVMIADDHAILRSGLKLLVNAQPDMEVVSEASNGEQAVQAARETKPDVALMDLTMPRTGGIGALHEIVRTCRQTRVLVLTMLAGTPAVSFLGAIGAAVTLRARRSCED